MIKLTVTRFGIKQVFKHNTIENAVLAALSDIESCQAYPLSITENNNIIWKNKGPFTESTNNLKHILNKGKN